MFTQVTKVYLASWENCPCLFLSSFLIIIVTIIIIIAMIQLAPLRRRERLMTSLRPWENLNHRVSRLWLHNHPPPTYFPIDHRFYPVVRHWIRQTWLLWSRNLTEERKAWVLIFWTTASRSEDLFVSIWILCVLVIDECTLSDALHPCGDMRVGTTVSWQIRKNSDNSRLFYLTQLFMILWLTIPLF